MHNLCILLPLPPLSVSISFFLIDLYNHIYFSFLSLGWRALSTESRGRGVSKTTPRSRGGRKQRWREAGRSASGTWRWGDQGWDRAGCQTGEGCRGMAAEITASPPTHQMKRSAVTNQSLRYPFQKWCTSSAECTELSALLFKNA